MRLLVLLMLALALPAAAQPRAPVLRGEFHGVASARDRQGVLSLTPALAAAAHADVLRIENRTEPAVYQSALTVREIQYDLRSPSGAKIAEVCAGACRVSGVIEWREPNDWWFREVTSAERLPPGFDFAALTPRAAPAAPAASVSIVTPDDPLHRTLSDTLRAAMEVELGQPLRFTPLALRRQGPFAYVVVRPSGPDGAEVDFQPTRWREQWRYGPWDGGIIHALFRNDGERWNIETFVISPVTDDIVRGWATNFRAPAALFRVDVRQAG